tara:strand:- start:2726 stop:2911 length:186 start_codon:yes stop_codon:yes gene_type:complete
MISFKVVQTSVRLSSFVIIKLLFWQILSVKTHISLDEKKDNNENYLQKELNQSQILEKIEL